MDPKERGKRKETEPRHDQPTGLRSKSGVVYRGKCPQRKIDRYNHHQRRTFNRSQWAHGLIHSTGDLCWLNHYTRYQGQRAK